MSALVRLSIALLRRIVGLLLALGLLHASAVTAETVQTVTQTSYDGAGRVLCTTTRMNPAVFGSLPSDACVLGTEGAQGPDRVTKNVYDAEGHVLQVRRAAGTPLEQAYATYAFTPNGQASDVIDANGNRAQYAYDGFDRQVRWTFPSTTRPTAFNSAATFTKDPSTTVTYSCDDGFTLSGTSCTGISDIVNATNNTCPPGYVIHYYTNNTYPPYCTLTVTIAAIAAYQCNPGYYPDGKCGRFDALTTAGATNSTDYEEYGYDVNGNRTSLRKRDGSVIAFSYDNLNRVTVKSVPERAGLDLIHTRDVYFAYDLRGLTTAVRFDSVTGLGVKMTYDALGRMTGSINQLVTGGGWITSQYDADGNRTRMTYPDANYVTYGYDGLNRPTAILRSGTSPVANYTYNNIGQRTGFNGAVTTSYAYDPIGRLSSLTNNLPASSFNNQYTFAYNPASQITQGSRSNDAFAWTAHVNADRNYFANGLNQYNVVGASNYCYDANGNLTADGTNVYLYDVENRLVEKRALGANNASCATLHYNGADQTLQASLRYDPLGRLYEITGSSGTTRMLNDGDALTAEYDTSGNLLRRYIHGADLKADDPIAWYEGSGFTGANERIMRPDWQGSIALVTDSTGANVLAVNRYDEYGIPNCPLVGGLPDCSAPGANAGRFQYTGQAWLAELGMYYYKARIYSPTMGRFLQTDPIGYKDQVNLYAYVGNDPIGKTDPSGLGFFSWLKNILGISSPPPPPPTPATTANQNPDEIVVTGQRLPKNFRPPTNPPQYPRMRVPEGVRMRISPPRPGYPNGYWQYEKPMANGGWQGINPSTMKPGPEPDVHVPFPTCDCFVPNETLIVPPGGEAPLQFTVEGNIMMNPTMIEEETEIEIP